MIAGAIGGFAFRDSTLKSLEGLCAQAADPEDDEFWTEVRKKFDVYPDLLMFNNAGLSPSPTVVRDAIANAAKLANQNPSFVIWRRQDSALDPIRSRLATMLGCDQDELALTINATYGLHTGIMGVDMEPGDRIVTTSHDYSRTHTAIAQRCRRDNTVSTTIPVTSPPEPPGVVTAQILAAVDDRTRLVVLSQMTFTGGQLLPTKAVRDGLNKRKAAVFVDGAHGIGLLGETVADMGADLYTACLHKWLMGPIGTGVFVVRRNWLKSVWPLHPADEHLDASARKFEQIGTRSAAPFLALTETLDFHEMVGRERKAARLEALRGTLASKIFDHPRIVNFGSLDPALARAVLLVGVSGIAAEQVAATLMTKYRIHVTTMSRAGVNAVRISPSIFTTQAEIETLANALKEIASEAELQSE